MIYSHYLHEFHNFYVILTPWILGTKIIHSMGKITLTKHYYPGRQLTPPHIIVTGIKLKNQLLPHQTIRKRRLLLNILFVSGFHSAGLSASYFLSWGNQCHKNIHYRRHLLCNANIYIFKYLYRSIMNL